MQYEENPIFLFEKLQAIDPEYGNIVHINNKKRLIRALEIFELTGFTPTEHFENQKKNYRYQYLGELVLGNQAY